ncbi:MAG: type II secretion system F family protein [Candidatus Magasanikbacteria bacterium]|nr:type II secretion system F family protein [Candidatus Magasanikbacteria bacterium]
MPTLEKQNPKPEGKVMKFINEHLTHIPFVQKIVFVHNLFIMTKAGLSIVDSLRILSAQSENKKLKRVISEIKSGVEKGRQLSEVLALFPEVFPPIYVSMIAAGEASGKMETALEQVASQMKKSHELTSRIRGALIYPAVILIAMAGIGIEMVVFVLPKIIVLFKDFNADLPLATRILIAIVTATGKYGIYMAIALVALVFGLIWLVKQPAVRRRLHAFNLFLPIMGNIIKKINIARFTMTLSSLLTSSIPITEAVRITASVQSNISYREALLICGEILKKGEPLSENLERYPRLFPPMVTQMIMVGEQTGEVETMLGELAGFYSDEVDTIMKNFSTIIEPVIILFLGLAVAGIAVAVIMPMYSLAQSF